MFSPFSLYVLRYRPFIKWTIISCQEDFLSSLSITCRMPSAMLSLRVTSGFWCIVYGLSLCLKGIPWIRNIPWSRYMFCYHNCRKNGSEWESSVNTSDWAGNFPNKVYIFLYHHSVKYSLSTRSSQQQTTRHALCVMRTIQKKKWGREKFQQWFKVMVLTATFSPFNNAC